MKRYITTLIAAAASMMIAATGCNKEQEFDYSGAAISDVNTHPGKNRALVEFVAPSGVECGKAFFEAGKYQEFTIDSSLEKQELIVENLPEGNNTIRISLLDGNGNQYDPIGFNVYVYGDDYSAGRTERKLNRQVTKGENSIELIFEDSKDADEIGVRVIFTRTSGQVDSMMVDKAANSISLEDIDRSEPYYFHTVFKPVEDCIDEFLSKNFDAKVAAMKNFEKELWTVTATSQDSGKPADNVCDNDASTFWRASTSGFSSVTIDFGSEKIFSSFTAVQAPDRTVGEMTNNFRIFCSSDGENWENIYEGRMKANGYKQSFKLKNTIQARYVRFAVVDVAKGVAPAQLAEIDFENDINVSGINGQQMPSLVNSTYPFEGDGSDLFATIGAGRMQRASGWMTNDPSYITFDRDQGNFFCIWCAPAWGCASITNGKVYQAITLLPGDYAFFINNNGAQDPDAMNIEAVIAKGEGLPDYTAIETDASVIGHDNVLKYQRATMEVPFSLDEETTVTVGLVYNITTAGTIWNHHYFNGFDIKMK